MNESVKYSLKETIVRGLIERIKVSLPDLAEGLRRFEVEVEGVSPLDWLGGQGVAQKIYFSDRDKSFEVAATGSVQIITERNSENLKDAFATIEHMLALSDSAIRYFGGVCFDSDDELASEWEMFGRYRFVVPEFEIRTEGEKTTFAYNVELARTENVIEIIDGFKEAVASVSFGISGCQFSDQYDVVSRVDSPCETQWNENVTQVINDLGDRRIQKVVLARKLKLETSMSVSPIEILKRVKENNIKTYDFCFQLSEGNAFLGCSPECLFEAQGGNIRSEALAGTRLKGGDALEQKEYHKQLVESQKEQLEHDYVLQDVNECLQKICDGVEVAGEREVVSLSYLQHFLTGFNGLLKDEVGTGEIIETLHPTAAVNGYPSQAAGKEIRKYESFSRGWFAGPVGWVGKDSAHFAVAIRSALIQGKEMSLYAGAGIVESSDPADEWQETENKIKQYLDAIADVDRKESLVNTNDIN